MRPVPIPDDVSRPFWEGASRRALLAQYCVECEQHQHPPMRECESCGSDRLEFRPLSGKGRIYSLQIMHDSRVSSMREYQPFVLALVEAVESPNIRFLSNLPGARPEDVGIGSERRSVNIGDLVEVEFEQLSDGVAIPQFHAWQQSEELE